MKSRESRKLDHIRYALCVGDGPCASGFSDVHLLHHCLSGICRNEVDLTCLLPGLPALAHPIIINAITGGADAVAKINESLAIVARETGSAMAVGSQFGTVRTGLHRDSYTIVRKCNPKGLIFANLSAFASVEQAKAAIDMISADALQIHLNPAQELAMEEGDRDFSNCLSHIEAMVQGVGVPVIVKETGCGMAKKEAQDLLDVGVTLLDIGGAGGTNFPAIEHQRYPEGNEELSEWGICPCYPSYRRLVGEMGSLPQEASGAPLMWSRPRSLGLQRLPWQVICCKRFSRKELRKPFIFCSGC